MWDSDPHANNKEYASFASPDIIIRSYLNFEGTSGKSLESSFSMFLSCVETLHTFMVVVHKDD